MVSGPLVDGQAVREAGVDVSGPARPEADGPIAAEPDALEAARMHERRVLADGSVVSRAQPELAGQFRCVEVDRFHAISEQGNPAPEQHG